MSDDAILAMAVDKPPTIDVKKMPWSQSMSDTSVSFFSLIVTKRSCWKRRASAVCDQARTALRVYSWAAINSTKDASTSRTCWKYWFMNGPPSLG